MVDLLMGGSPCQGFSVAGKQLNFDDPRSKLFFDFAKAKNELKPRYFLLENVKMKKEYQDIISEHMGVEPIEINSALVSAQNRKRLYWTNIPSIGQPADKGILLKDIIESGSVDRDKSYCIDANCFKGGSLKNYMEKKLRQQVLKQSESRLMVNECIQVGEADLNGHDIIKRVYSIDGKCPTLTGMGGGNLEKKIAIDNENWRKLTVIECERLQTLPDGYTEGVSNTQRYKAIGNGWTVDVIAHILSFIPENYLHTVVSLFDGISCGQVALGRAGKVYNQYYSSEIDKYAIKITQKNYPQTMQLGDVTEINWNRFLEMTELIKTVNY